MKYKKARLIFTSICNKSCRGCCNQNWKYKPPKEISISELKKYDEINITGGEPMLFPIKLLSLIKKIRTGNNKIFLYTAYPYPLENFYEIIEEINGCSVTIHTLEDKKNFLRGCLDLVYFKNKSMRLNVFTKHKFNVSKGWDYREKRWIKDCPLPKDEELVKLKI